MKCFLTCVAVLAGTVAFSQELSDVQTQVTDFNAYRIAVQPDSSQIVYETPPALLKASGIVVMPDASAIIATTPPELMKATGGVLQPNPGQIVTETPAGLRKKED